MTNYPTTEEQRKKASEAIKTLCELFDADGGACFVSELHMRAGDIIEARMYDRNSKGEKYIVHGPQDDVNGFYRAERYVDENGDGHWKCDAPEEIEGCGEPAMKTVTASFVCR